MFRFCYLLCLSSLYTGLLPVDGSSTSSSWTHSIDETTTSLGEELRHQDRFLEDENEDEHFRDETRTSLGEERRHQDRFLEDGNEEADEGGNEDADGNNNAAAANNNNNNINNDDNTDFQYDLSDFSVRFDRCQYIKTFDPDLNEDQDVDRYDPFSIRHFVVFRLCPTGYCGDCSDVPHGRYVMEADEYIQATVQEQSKRFEETCNNCQDDCFYQANDDAAAAAAGDDDNAAANNYDASACLNSNGCGKQCYLQQNLEANGYVDAANYLECQQVDMQNYYNNYAYSNGGDDDNNNNNVDDNAENAEGDANNADGDDAYNLQLYIGPRCSSSGDRILLGLFWDGYCTVPYTELEPEDVLGYEISYAMLQHTLDTDGSNCLSCQEDVDENNNNANDQADGDNVNEMCELVYADAGKCESTYGIEEGFMYANRDGGEQVNQVENEAMVCTWIESLMLGSYTESGEINLEGDQITIYRTVTPLQKTAFSLLMLSVVSLIVAAVSTQRQIEKSMPKVDLSCQTDAVIT